MASEQPKLTVGLFPYLPKSKEIREALPTQVGSFSVQYVDYDCYGDDQTLPDVFCVDTMYIPYLANKQIIKAVDEQLVKDVSGEVHSFTTESVKVNGSMYGFPQFLCSNFLFSTSSATTKASSLLELAEKVGYEKVVFPSLVSAEPFTVLSVYEQFAQINADTTIADLPQKADQVNKDACGKYRTVLNASLIASGDEYAASVNAGKPLADYFVGYSESLFAAKNALEQGNYTAQIIGASDKPVVYTDAFVLNAQLTAEKQKVAVEVVKTILSSEKVLSLLYDGLTVPAQKATIQKFAQKSSIFKQLSEQFDSLESNIKLYRNVDFTTADVKKVATVIKPFIQHIAVGTLRCLTADTVEKAKSGHPGMPIGMSPIAYILWKFFFKASKDDLHWMNRDRFVLSNGHGCSLLYAMLHLTDCNLSMDDLKKFRTLDSKTPGHPEYGHTEGVDATTGPLGQGICNAVGMAVSEAHLAARFNKDQAKLFDHFTYVFCGDGCLMEGIVTEGMSFAGHQELGKLIVFYDDNSITIDGSTKLTFTQNTPQVAEGLGWNVITVKDADNDLLAIKLAIEQAHTSNKPTMIICKTTIGYATKMQGTAKVHGSPLGADALKNLKEICGFSGDQFFHVPEVVREDFSHAIKRNSEKHSEWKQLKQKYDEQFPAESQLLQRMANHELEGDLLSKLPQFNEDKKIATRSTSHQVLNAIYPLIPSLVGGSADLTPSNLTDAGGASDFQPDNRTGRYFRFGVREHAMVAIANGILYHGLLRTYVATFLNFASYALGAIRLSALSHLPNIFVFTHDSIGVGQDGPTHQPVEVLPVLRSIPNHVVFRPADGRETSGSYLFAIQSTKTPTSLILSRQDLPQLKGTDIQKTLLGAYTIQGTEQPDVVLVGTGSEVSMMVEAAKLLGDLKVNVVSMPSWELFGQQSLEYRKSVFPTGVPVVSAEASSTFGWTSFSHYCVGMTTFGMSAPAEDIYKRLGITPENVADKARKLINKYGKNAPQLTLSLVGEDI